MMIEKRKNNSVSIKTILLIFLGSSLVSGIVIFAALYVLLKPPPATPYYLQGNPEGVRELSQPRSVTDFTLPSSHGVDLGLADFAGQHVVLFFGYTHCPDVCQTTLSDLRRVHSLLGDEAEQLQFIFVSVDGKRDTPERLAAFLETFRMHEYTVGMQGEDVILQRIAPDYSLYYELHEDEGEYYTVDHTASLYYINPDGELDTIFAYGTRPDIIADYLSDKLD